MTDAHDDDTTPGLPDAVARVRDQAKQLQRIVEPTLRTMGYELVLLEWLGNQRPRTLRLFIDHADGITLDDCARLSPIVSNALDAAEHHDPALAAVLDSAYNLEISSPGLDRPLARRSHFERYVGARATIRTHAPIALDHNQKNFKGRIAGTTPDPAAPDDDELGTIALVDDDDPSRTFAIPLALVRRANLVYEGTPEAN
ncbi:MAG TPA: ribosome maturation factor RimP [Nannocystaceae bacterium]|nr:ribosome maturation factor RimP [Nannocystaceae bacterium]